VRAFVLADIHALNLAEQVIAKANHAHPADVVLRHELIVERRIAPELKRAVSRAVFAYYRWIGWLPESQALQARINKAIELDAQFQTKADSFSDEELISRAVPAWVSGEMEVTDPWVRALQCEPKLWLRARPGQALSLAKELGECWVPAKAPLADALIYEGREDLFHTPEFHAGKFELQDISSQAVSVLCEPQPGETWWDACAGEGGKLLHLSDLMTNQGLIWASDRAAWRLQKLKRRAARAKAFNYRSALWNGGATLPTKTKFDGVLLDAPCSGIGTWHRNPHARWTATLNDVRELSELQERLLAHAAPAVKSGGKLVYAVCTLTRAETAKVVASFEKQFPEFQRLDLVNPFKPSQRSLGKLWCWPQECQGNGMFVAGWKKS